MIHFLAFIMLALISVYADAALIPLGGVLHGDTDTIVDSTYGSFSARSTDTSCPIPTDCRTAIANISASIQPNAVSMDVSGKSVAFDGDPPYLQAQISGHIGFELPTAQNVVLTINNSLSIYGYYFGSLRNASGTISNFSGPYDTSGLDYTETSQISLPGGQYDLSLSFGELTVVGTGGPADVSLTLSAVPIPATVWLFGSALGALSIAAKYLMRRPHDSKIGTNLCRQ